ncbi:MAG: Mini-ribonuclease 3 [Clostridiales bacterium]|nr:Mini-ribonuclease 3 [Clostridiales bacterium]
MLRDLPGSLQLAYLGDTLYDLYVRERLVREGGRVDDLHRAAVRYVRASAQSAALERIEPMLTEEEAGVVRRARNARQTPPRNADIHDYHRATALEALLGALYLSGETERLRELMEVAIGNCEIHG